MSIIVPVVDEMTKFKLFTWLQHNDSSQYYNEAREKRTLGTGKWFIEGAFRNWQLKAPSFLWVYGKGK